MRLRLATGDDAAAIAAVYAPYVTGSIVSFETEVPDGAAMRQRIEAGGALYPWLVAQAGAELLGYAYASPFRTRPAYRFAVETSVYLAPGAQRRGIGARLYGALIEMLEAQHFAQAIGAITLPNAASVRLHERLGFAPVGTYAQVGWKLGGWHDVGLWQRPLAPATVPPAEPLPFAAVAGAVLSPYG